MILEKRAQAERDRCAIEATIRFIENEAVIPCLVVDLTERGAGLSLDESVDLPARFRLALPLTDDLCDERLVELRWRRGRSAGVVFIRP